jgi:hypothetical protein
MKTKILLKLAEKVLPSLLDLAVKLLEEIIKYDLDQDGKIGK